MAWFNEDNPSTLNFMVVGPSCSGYGLLQSALNAHTQIVCHGDVLHPNSVIRKAEHEKYFGESGKIPDWFVQNHISVEQYLNNKIFDNTLNGEKAVGVKVNYQYFPDYDLWDYTNQKYRKGDFCLVHVTRNPVACYVALKKREKRATTLFVDPAELTSFVRFQEAMQKKINTVSSDRIIIPFHEFVLGYKRVMTKLFDYLELSYESCIPEAPIVTKSDSLRGISNLKELRMLLPMDVKAYLDAPNLF